MKRLQSILNKAPWNMEAVYPFNHPANKVPNALMIRYDGFPRIKLQKLPKGGYLIIQIYNEPLKHLFHLYGCKEKFPMSYNELCKIMRLYVEGELHSRRRFWSKRRVDFPEDWIVEK